MKMKAKDIDWCPQHGYPLPCNKCGLGDWEDGKKAGIKEVVDRLGVFENELGFCEISNHIPYQELKKWGGSPPIKERRSDKTRPRAKI